MKALQKADAVIGRVFTFLGVADMAVLGVIMAVNVFIRFTGIPVLLSWYSEVVEILFAWMVMIGAVILCRNSAHFRVDLFYQKLGHRRGFYWLEAICYIIAFVFYLYFFRYSLNLALNAPQTMPVLHIPKGAAYACMPICAAFMCAYTVRDICCAILRATGKRTIGAAR